MNFLNPALTARAFLFFAYPAAMSGDAAWIAADFTGVDGYSGATWLAQAAVSAKAARRERELDGRLHRLRARLHGRDLDARLRCSARAC